jgi:hypothetical protein|tara:strand:+ start:1100 stop:1303 length:204 start_codon:yes stop_codon:yes gene_type:complete
VIGGYWQNKHTHRLAEIVSEPLSGVFELRYLEETGKHKSILENQRWCSRDLHKHWEYIGDEPIDEEE